MQTNCDVVILGAGVVGVAIARELVMSDPSRSVIVVEKEPHLGVHSSGRNSGVLHSGIYYAPGTLKAALCTQGARELIEYCRERDLPLNPCGKVLIPTNEQQLPELDYLYNNAKQNGVAVEMIDAAQLKEIEPEANRTYGRALYTPATSVIDPKKLLQSLQTDCVNLGVKFQTATEAVGVDMAKRTLKTTQGPISYNILINAAGLFADKVARWFDIGKQYSIIPFRGAYYKLQAPENFKIRRNIYPVPDRRFPFLGIHFTPSAYGDISVGPSAMPALGRENYSGLKGATGSDLFGTSKVILREWFSNRQGFRAHLGREIRQLGRRGFWRAAQGLVPGVEMKNLVPSNKVGIRAQLINNHTRELLTDFHIEEGPSSLHILNAVSPAMTCSLTFARHVCGLSPIRGSQTAENRTHAYQTAPNQGDNCQGFA